MLDTEKQQKTLKVAFYIRVSTDEQADKYGPEMQRSALDAIIASRGTLKDGITPAMELAGEHFVYFDHISGTEKLPDRPGFARLQEDIFNSPEGTKPFDLVAVYKIDRFARRLKLLLEVIDFFRDHDILFISAHESIDTSTPFGRAMLGIVGVLSELEMETIRQRMSDGRLEAIKRGTFSGNTPPYGYIKDDDGKLEIIESEAEIVKQIYDMVLIDQTPIHTICRILKDMQIMSPGESAIQLHKRKGRSRKKSSIHFWSIPTITNLLTDEVYIGNYYYGKTEKGQKIPKDQWKLSDHHHLGIIDSGTFFRVQDILRKRKTTHTRDVIPGRHIYLLAGLLKCGCCYLPERDNEVMQSLHGEPKEIAKGTGNYSHYYKCRRKNSGKSDVGCGSLPLPADQLEEYVIERIRELLSNPATVYDYQKQLNSAKQEQAQLEASKKQYTTNLNGIPARINNLKEQNEHGFLSISDLEIQILELNNKKIEFTQKIKELDVRISTNKLDEGYIRSFEIFDTKYRHALEDISKNREKIKQLLHIIIDRIEVYSRPIIETDKIAGRRTPNQQIPNTLVIRLRLPQEYLQMLKAQIDKQSEEFGVSSTILSG